MTLEQQAKVNAFLPKSAEAVSFDGEAVFFTTYGLKYVGAVIWANDEVARINTVRI